MELNDAAEDGIRRFFNYSRARYGIYLKKQAGESKPWSDDPIFQRYPFTNIFREDDKTTVWFREQVRKRYEHDSYKAFMAPVIFRWFNRISTCDAIFNQTDMFNGLSPFEATLECGDPAPIEAAVSRLPPPYMTGAYIIVSVTGMKKLPGVVEYIRRFMKHKDWRAYAQLLVDARGQYRLEAAWAILKDAPGLGPFLAYELVTDLRYTHLLNGAPDINTWANPGPGALRGAGRVLGTMRVRNPEDGEPISRKKISKENPKVALELMRELVYRANTAPLGYWPSDWPAWEMREAEHTLCEFDKYERTRLGQGTPRGTYNGLR